MFNNDQEITKKLKDYGKQAGHWQAAAEAYKGPSGNRVDAKAGAMADAKRWLTTDPTNSVPKNANKIWDTAYKTAYNQSTLKQQNWGDRLSARKTVLNKMSKVKTRVK